MGFVAGAVVGALARSLVMIIFFSVEGHFGEPFVFVCTIALFNGVIIGGVAGATCRPLVATVLGAALSGFCCYVLGVIPGNILTEMVPHDPNFHRHKRMLIVGLVLMMTAGALAGAIGATVGRYWKQLTRRS